MEKNILKDVLSKVNPGDTIEVNFAGEKSPLSGAFKVLSSKTGRGKCGSRIASLESLSDHTTLSIGTPTNQELVNITYQGEKYGYSNATEAMPVVSRDSKKATELKDKLKCLVGFGGRQLSITSALEPEFNGLFNLRSAELSKGRFGQIILKLTNVATNQNIELWSYRHSTVIDSIDIME